MSKQVIALYDSEYVKMRHIDRMMRKETLIGYFMGMRCVGAFAKNPLLTKDISEACVFNDQHAEEMKEIMNSLKNDICYKTYIIRTKEV